ncbi:hypothetical protein K2173_009520 [Erythroxylum novogranatense]|uniref:PX domain-containing protein n=1 Tax=Erythroxylum novogranatense TaxID=1862640 RepID=A0AAV8U7M1_9ROSI|nr:hypothetical protein K2173_009520 [Erythroxylum novogranatense]
MNLYTHDLSLFDFTGLSDPIIDPISLSHHHHPSYLVSSSSTTHLYDHHKADGPSSNSSDGKAVISKPESPPRHRHDGTSPLPLGMDWSLPPRKWDGRDSIWPHDPHTGWSYCVTVPSWVLLPSSRGSNVVTFYRVQIGIQSPEGVTITRGILRRFSDFLKLLSDLRKAFPLKTLPPPPPKKVLRLKSRRLLEERRCALEDWMEKLLSDIEVSRSASIGTFLELEAAARLFFDDAYQQLLDATSSFSGMITTPLFQANSDISLLAGSSLITSDHGNYSRDEISELGNPGYEEDYNFDADVKSSTCESNIDDHLAANAKDSILNRSLENLQGFSWRKVLHGREIGKSKPVETVSKALPFHSDGPQTFPELEYQGLDGHLRRLSSDSIGSDLTSIRASEVSNLGLNEFFGDDSLDFPEGAETSGSDVHASSNLHLPRDALVVLPAYERTKLNRVLDTVQRRLTTAKTDMEDLIARGNQEVALRQFLTTKVKDLEMDLETTRTNCKDNMQQAVFTERERFNQMQWDVEELRRQCLELEIKLKYEQDEKSHVESTKAALIQENELLLHQLDVAREELENLHKNHEELELKSKADIKLLVKEVKSLRGSQLELKQELSRLMKEKIEIERVLQKEKQRMEYVNTSNTKLLHECEILRNRLQECSVNFLIEEEDKLVVETSSPSDAIDLLTTSDNRIGLLLAEAQLLAQDVENSLHKSDETRNNNGNDGAYDDPRKMLTEIFIDNARLRMQVNSVIRYTLSTIAKSDKEEEEEEGPFRNTVLSKFLER